jgi:hypothetical protein
MKNLLLSVALGSALLSAPAVFAEDAPQHRTRGDKIERHHKRNEGVDRRRDDRRRDWSDHRTRRSDATREHKRYRHHSDRREIRDRDRYERRHYRDRYAYQRGPVKRYRAPVRHHHYYPRTSDYLLGGLVLGSLAYQLTFDHAGPNFDFWRDYDGNCYRVEYRRRGRVYVDVPRRSCAW